ncbi:MAG: hypothetical protein KF730_14080 [Sphingomonas sp.]|uniref:hypothetical protein n=1 Tax=Sphingomonas sp. TaxID=28214 RepID=UPI0025D26F07|nr:hypothetical protein [Sphingomonas sp.]MBX3565693.1 hypothetical protein [Sphingomonas sp.]
MTKADTAQHPRRGSFGAQRWVAAGSAAILLLAAGAPPCQDAQPSRTAPQSGKKVRKGVRTVGTPMGKRFRMTPSEWRRFTETTRRDAGLLRNRSTLTRAGN